MDSAPWKIFQFEGREVVIDVDGGITIDDYRATPFPCEISHAAICDKGLVATWVDHELRLARMALLPPANKIILKPANQYGAKRPSITRRKPTLNVVPSSVKNAQYGRDIVSPSSIFCIATALGM